MKLAVAWDPLSFTDGDGGSLEKSQAAFRSKPLRPVARQEGAIASSRRAECLKLYAEMKGFVVEHLRLLGRNWLRIDVYGRSTVAGVAPTRLACSLVGLKFAVEEGLRAMRIVRRPAHGQAGGAWPTFNPVIPGDITVMDVAEQGSWRTREWPSWVGAGMARRTLGWWRWQLE